MTAPAPTREDQGLKHPQHPRFARERRAQLRGLFLLALAILLVSLFRAGVHNIFLPGWWRVW